MPQPSTAVATREEQQPLTLQDQILTGLQEHKGEIRAFLPNEDAQRRFMRIVIRALNDSDRLRLATPSSIVNAAIEAAMYGLEPSGHIGGAHLVPFKNSDTNELEAQLITDYRGDVHLARQSKEVSDAYAEVVRATDRFVDDRAQATVIHEPNLTAKITNNPDEPGNEVVAAYACIVFKDGFRRFVVMSRQEIDSIRAMAPGKNSPAWRNHWPEMAKKTVLKRALKTAPLPPMVRSLISREDTLDYTQPVRATVERPRGESLADRLEGRQAQLGTTEQPDGAASAQTAADGGEAANVGAAAASSNQQPGDDGTPSVASTTPPATHPEPGKDVSSDGAPAVTGHQVPESQPHEAGDEPSPAAKEEAGGVPTAGPSSSTLMALHIEPSAETFLAFALEVLGMEGVELKELNAVEIGQVIDEAVDSEEQWAVLYGRLPSVVKATIRAVSQHPRGRATAPEASAQPLPDRPNAEQLRTAMGGAE